MKKVSFLICMALASASFSFTLPSAATGNIVVSDVQFKVINDTNAAFDYAVDGQHYTIAVNQSKGFSFPAGTIIYRWTNGAQGATWFTVTAEMQGGSFKLSELPQ
jgi:hypothetical protein